MSSWRMDIASFISRVITLQKKVRKKSPQLHFTSQTCWYYSVSPSIFILCSSSLPFCTFAASIIFDKSQIFHSHASGRFPSTWDGSIISSSFAWLKPDKHNALCRMGNAFCIILVFEYISEYLPLDWSQFLASIQTLKTIPGWKWMSAEKKALGVNHFK